MATIVVEGIPGAGKTAISTWLSHRLGLALYPEDILVPEVFSLWRTYQDDDVRIFLLHWEVKARIAKLLRQDAVWDRNHITALAYSYAKAHLAGDAHIFDTVLRWYHTGIETSALQEPQQYLILDVSPEASLCRRAQTIAECAWACAEGLALSRAFYLRLEEFLYPYGPGTQQPQVIRVAADGALAEVQACALTKLNAV